MLLYERQSCRFITTPFYILCINNLQTISEHEIAERQLQETPVSYAFSFLNNQVVGLTTEDNEDVKKRKEAKYTQKESILQPLTKASSKLDDG